MDRRAHEGDETSFEDVARTHLAALRHAARGMTRVPADADDLVQETLLRAFGAFDRLEPGSHVRAWLLRILSNTHISRWRRVRRERALLVPGVWQTRVPWLEPSDVGEGRGDGLPDEVLAALDALPPAYRRCVLLVDVEERTYRDAAQAIGRPVGTVMSRLHRARRMLRESLSDHARAQGVRAAA